MKCDQAVVSGRHGFWWNPS